MFPESFENPEELEGKVEKMGIEKMRGKMRVRQVHTNY
jgi:hypothetical protein